MHFAALIIAAALAASGCRTGRDGGAVKNADATELDAATANQTVSGAFNSIACPGSCPGYQFTVNGQKIWVDPESAQSFSSILQDGELFQLTGHWETKPVFTEAQGAVPMQLFVVSSIVPSGGGAAPSSEQEVTATFKDYACANRCPGYLFEADGDKIWVDFQSAEATQQPLQNGKAYMLTGQYGKTKVFDESRGYVESEVLVVSKVVPAAAVQADTTVTGVFHAVACAGSCPGFSFTIDGKKIWVDAPSAQPFKAILSNGKTYVLTGHYEKKAVFSEAHGQQFIDVLVASKIVTSNGTR